jgi:hypothetical protein
MLNVIGEPSLALSLRHRPRQGYRSVQVMLLTCPELDQFAERGSQGNPGQRGAHFSVNARTPSARSAGNAVARQAPS